ncbi:MAG TPA: bidirectional hydrogenase complex protein HoxU [Anaerolineae bacterium]|nr:bidirectional hydrogenase complex protein HoxU [Anaerolineae bacterium]HMR65692.1 bidirectional hydrogenase complex protein HoxU [Anaerolineae bacterium]
MTVITLTINDELVSANSGQSLLEVIREHDIYLPTLCHMDGLSERGGCRMCLVEVAGSRGLQAACVAEATEGMVVTTHSERLNRYRRMILELIFAERNHVCAVCVMNGHCELQAIAAIEGMDHVRYDYLHPDLPMDISHDRFGIDHNRCILCLRCVRVCDEVEGAHTKDVMGRGVNCRIVHDLNQPWGTSQSCTSCGKCVQVCPTGALFSKGSSVAEMVKRHDFLSWIMAGREKNEWSYDGQQPYYSPTKRTTG